MFDIAIRTLDIIFSRRNVITIIQVAVLSGIGAAMLPMILDQAHRILASGEVSTCQMMINPDVCLNTATIDDLRPGSGDTDHAEPVKP